MPCPAPGNGNFQPPAMCDQYATAKWRGTLLENLPEGAFMYFVHSFVVRPKDEKLVLSATRYGGHLFCSAIRDDTRKLDRYYRT